MSKSPRPSQTRARAGPHAEFFTVIALVWNTVVWRFLVPQADVPVWFKSAFAAAGALILWGALAAWRVRLKGCAVRLKLPVDPVPHGQSVPVSFELVRALDVTLWEVEARIESSARNQSGFGRVWQQTFPAQAVGATHVTAQVELPEDLPSTAASDRDMTYHVVLVLKADKLVWDFHLSTRAARAGDAGGGRKAQQGSTHATRQSQPPELARAARRKLNAIISVLVVFILVFQASNFFDWQLWARLRAMMGAGAYSTAVTTDKFEIFVTNYLVKDWALSGRLRGDARVRDGVLSVDVQSLDIQPAGTCAPQAGSCTVQSVQLLLSEDGDTHFSQLAISNALVVNADLRELGRWSLPKSGQARSLQLSLPAALEVDGVRLKLRINFAGGATVYPDHGNTLALQRALAKANGQADPCDSVSSRLDLVQDGCNRQLQLALQLPNVHKPSAIARTWHWLCTGAAKIGLRRRPPGPLEVSLDALLFSALESENFAAAQMLIDAGANPNARRTDGDLSTPLDYAEAANNQPMVKRLQDAGAIPNGDHARTLQR